MHAPDKKIIPLSVKRGRRPKGSASIDAESIIDVGFNLARSMPLSEISLVRVAKEMGVTAASIHYYMKTRDKLTIGITNRWFGELVSKWPAVADDWRAHLQSVSWTIYGHCIAYPGVGSYLANENRFKLALAITEKQDAQHMSRFLDLFLAAVLRSGMNGKQASLFAFLLSQFILTSAHATASHQTPGEQSRFRQLLLQYDKRDYPAIVQLRQDYAKISGDEAFEAGLNLLMNGFQQMSSA